MDLVRTLRPVIPDHATEHAIRLFLEEIASQYKIVGAVLFGSRARGNLRADSDADLAVLLSGRKENPFPIIRNMARTAFDVMIETEILVEALPIWLDDWEYPEQASNPQLVQNIRREGITVRCQ